jgi:galactosylceramidase
MTLEPQRLTVRATASDPLFEGIGAVNGGGATSVLLKDYPEPQRSQILDLVFTPMLGASVSTMLVEVPGDGNSTQGSMPSHMHSRDDLDPQRGYTWWVLREAARRNPAITRDAVAWSAPGWIGDGEFWSQDMADYYVSWLLALRDNHGLELDAIGCRNEKGVSTNFASLLRATLDAEGFAHVRIHAFDNWPDDKFDFVLPLLDDRPARDAIDVIGAHVLYAQGGYPTAEVIAAARQMDKPIWNTEDHVYRSGFDALIGIVECFNDNYLLAGATKVVLWYDIAGVYPLQPYSVDPAMIIAHEPWSGHYVVREAIWGYAHYGQFTNLGWRYTDSASGSLSGGGSAVTLRSDDGDFSVIIETKDTSGPQLLHLEIDPDLRSSSLCVWRSDAREQFVRMDDIEVREGSVELVLEPDSVYSLSTTRGQRKGTFGDIPDSTPFPLPYSDNFRDYSAPARRGRLPRYLADVSGAFELFDDEGQVLRQMVPAPTISWAPDWRTFSIIGDSDWRDYEVGVTVRLDVGESAAVMGRVNDVGSGYGFEPRCYYLQITAEGECTLVCVDGRVNPNEPRGDAEQQALIHTRGGAGGGEWTLGQATLPAAESRRLSLRFQGRRIVGSVDGEPVISITDETHSRGMAGLLAGSYPQFSRPRYSDLTIAPLHDGQTPLHNPREEPLYPGKD